MSQPGELQIFTRYLVTIGTATELVDLFVEEVSPSLQRVRRSWVEWHGEESVTVSEWLGVDRLTIVEELPLTEAQLRTLTAMQSAKAADMAPVSNQ